MDAEKNELEGKPTEQDELSHPASEEEPVPEPAAPKPVPPEILAKLPPEAREVVQSLTAAVYSGPVPNPIAEKITSDHITQLITARNQDAEREHVDRKDTRRWATVLIGLCLVVGVGMVVFLVIAGQVDLADRLMERGILLGGGVGIGYGISEWRRRRME